MFNNIIVGVDGQCGGHDAVALAAELGSGTTTLVTAYPYDNHPSRASLRAYAQLLRDDTQRALEAERLRAGIDAELVPVADISPARAIQQEAERRDADLIVVGSAHRGRFGRVLLGDTARGVLHDAPCAVAVAPHRYRVGRHPIARVGVGVDGSPESVLALETAAAIAAERAATLVVTAVWEDPTSAVLMGSWAPGAYALNFEDLAAEARDGATEMLERVTIDLPATADRRVQRGSPQHVLEELSTTVDLLVVGSRGWGTVRRVALGSTSDHLVHHASCPVLVMQRPDEVQTAPAVVVEGAAATL